MSPLTASPSAAPALPQLFVTAPASVIAVTPLYDWLIRGLLGNRKAFAAHYRTPVEKRDDRARQRLLSARIEPFLLPLTKGQVARELPEKTATFWGLYP